MPCFESLGHLTLTRCHCGTAYLRLEKCLWLKAVEMIAAGGSVKWLVISMSSLQEMRNRPSKDWDASDTVKVCLNFAVDFLQQLINNSKYLLSAC